MRPEASVESKKVYFFFANNRYNRYQSLVKLLHQSNQSKMKHSTDCISTLDVGALNTESSRV